MLATWPDIYPELRQPQFRQSRRPRGPLYLRLLHKSGLKTFFAPEMCYIRRDSAIKKGNIVPLLRFPSFVS